MEEIRNEEKNEVVVNDSAVPAEVKPCEGSTVAGLATIGVFMLAGALTYKFIVEPIGKTVIGYVRKNVKPVSPNKEPDTDNVEDDYEESEE